MVLELNDLPATDVEFGDETLDDVPGLLREMRAESPMWQARYFGQPSLMLLSHELVHDAFRDEETLPGFTMYRATVENSMGRTVISMQGEEHRLNRAIMTTPFRPKVVESYQRLVESTAIESIEPLIPRGRAELVGEFAKLYPMRLMCRLIGLPRGHDDDLSRWAMALIRSPGDPNVPWRRRRGSRSSSPRSSRSAGARRG